MMLYLIAGDSLKKLEAIMRRMPNRTKDEHRDVRELAGIIESIEQNPHDDPDDE